MKTKATLEEQTEMIKGAVETAITQAAETSGLRNWMIWCHLRQLKNGEWPNEEAIVQAEGRSLEYTFEAMIDPDDLNFAESVLGRAGSTEESVFRPHELIKPSEIAAARKWWKDRPHE